MEAVRLNKFLCDAGVCSRRQGDKLIEEGKVKVNGVVATLGMRVFSNDEVLVEGKKIGKSEFICLVFNKPVGIVCTEDKEEKDNIIDFIGYPKRITYMGRLDKDSEGLMLMTNDGDLIHQMMKGRFGHEKEYIVTVNKKISSDFIKKMSEGVPILDTITRKCKVEKISEFTFRIVLTQGLNRQIRRMCEYFQYKVVKLKRVRIMNVELGDLKPGTYRELTKEEYQKLITDLEYHKQSNMEQEKK